MAKRPQSDSNRFSAIYDSLLPVATGSRDIRRDYPINLLELWELDPRDDRTQAQIEEMGEWLKNDERQDELVKVRPHPDPEKRENGFMQILGGGTRREGAAFIGWTALDIEVLHHLDDDRDALDYAYRNNSKRNPMSPLSHAKYFVRRGQMEESHTSNPEESLRKIGKKAGLTGSRIHQYVDLLTLPENVQAEMRRLGLNEKHGRGLLDLKEHPDLQLRLLREIERLDLSGNKTIDRASELLDDLAKDISDQAGSSDQSGNHDDADFAEGDAALANTGTNSKRNKAGKGGVGGTPPAGQGAGFSNTSSGGSKRGPRQTPAVPGQTIINVTEELRSLTEFYTHSTKAPSERFEGEVDAVVSSLEDALNQLKNARKKLR